MKLPRAEEVGCFASSFMVSTSPGGGLTDYQSPPVKVDFRARVQKAVTLQVSFVPSARSEAAAEL